MKKKHVLSFGEIADNEQLLEEHLKYVGLLNEEYKKITRLLGKIPNKIELLIIGALFSERCSDKFTKAHISKLVAKKNKRELLLKDGWSIIQKISQVALDYDTWQLNLYELISEIVAMGARPLVLAHTYNHNDSPKSKEALAKISSYCNELLIPTIKNRCSVDSENDAVQAVSFVVALAKEIYSYSLNPSGLKNRVLLVNSPNGLDNKALAHKNLFDACHNAFKQGLITRAQTIGTGGLAFAAFKLVSPLACGLRLNLDEIPGSENSSFEALLSEEAGRMLILVESRKHEALCDIFASFNVSAVDIGGLSTDGFVRFTKKGVEIVNLAATLLLENTPRLRLNYQSTIPKPRSVHDDFFEEALFDNFFLEQMIFKKESELNHYFDPYLSLNTIISKDESDAALFKSGYGNKYISLAITKKFLTISNAYEETKKACFEVLLGLAAQGSSFVSMSCSIAAGSADDELEMTKFMHAIDALSLTIEELNLSLASIRGSLASLNPASFITVAAIGASDAMKDIRFANASRGDFVVLLGDLPSELAGSEKVFLKNPVPYCAAWKLESVKNLIKVTKEISIRGLSCAISVVESGGLYKSLLKFMAKSQLGINLDFQQEWLRKELLLNLISEASPRVLMIVPERYIDELLRICAHKVAVSILGTVGAKSLTIRHQEELLHEIR